MKIYLYPPLVRGKYDNDYLSKLFGCLAASGFAISEASYGERGVYSLMKSIWRKFDWIYLNWFGASGFYGFKALFVEFFHLFVFCVHLIKGSKIVFVIHNFKPHQGKVYFNCFQKIYYKYSTLLICHSVIIFDIVPEIYHNKSIVITHPTKPELLKFRNVDEKSYLYDFLVWGSMIEYKGIKEIVNFFRCSSVSFRLALVGKCLDLDLFKWLESMTKGTNIHVDILNIDDSSIVEYHYKSRYVLFNYSPDSAIISASVMYSMSLGSRICMRRGNQYCDLSDLGCIFLFDSLDTLVEGSRNYNWQIDNQINYVLSNDWSAFRLNLVRLLK